MKLQRIITICILGFLAYACETPMLISPEDVGKGIFVTFDPGNMNINSEDIAGTPISGTFDNPSNNVASHEISVKRIYDMGESESEYILLETIEDFPYEFSVDGSELAELFGVEIEEINANTFQFDCRATGNNGQVADYDNLHDDVIGSAEQLQGFRFQGVVVCPSDPTLIVGTYSTLATAQFVDFAEPVVDFAHTVTIAESGEEGYYTISSYSFGTYDYFYGTVGWIPAGDWEGTVRDVCGSFFIDNTFDPWGDTVLGVFTFNDDGTITVVGGNTYGDAWTAVLTKQ